MISLRQMVPDVEILVLILLSTVLSYPVDRGRERGTDGQTDRNTITDSINLIRDYKSRIKAEMAIFYACTYTVLT